MKLSKIPIDFKWNFAYFPVVFDGYKLNRNEIQKKLAEDNVFARKYFYPIVNKMGCYEAKYGQIKLPIAEHVAECVLTLPLYSDMTLEDVDRVCDGILK